MRRNMPLGRLVLALTVAASVTMLSAAASVARPWLGVYTQEVTSDLREGLDLHADEGVLVNRVVPDSPADRAGLRKGDVIVRLDSHSIDTPEDLANWVRDQRADHVVSLEINRNGDQRTLQVTLADRPERDDDDSMAPGAPEPPTPPAPPGDDEDNDRGKDKDKDNLQHRDIRVHIDTPDAHGTPRVYRFDNDNPDQVRREARRMQRDMRSHGSMLDMPGMGMMAMGRPRLGVRVEPLTDDLGRALDVQGGEGVLVLGVNDDTPASRAGLKAGDVILSVEGRPVKDVESLHQALADVNGRCSLGVSRRGERRTIEATLGSRRDRDDNGDEDVSPAPRPMEGRPPAMRPRDREAAGADQMRRQIEELRQQVRELQDQLEEQKQHR